MSLQLHLFPVDSYISKKNPILHAQKEEKLSIINDIELDYNSYPFEDDEPMAQDTRQADIMVNIKNALTYIFDNRKDVFVGIDLFLYLTRYEVKAPDILVAKGVKYEKNKKSFIINREEKSPDVVIEVLSTSNYKDKSDLKNRLNFYAKCKVKEFYVIHTQPKLRIDIYFLVNNSYYNQILNFHHFYDDYLECSIYVENQELIIENKENVIIDNFTKQAKARKEAENQAKLEAEARKEAENQAKLEAEIRKQMEKQAEEAKKQAAMTKEENKKLLSELEELRKLLNKQKTSSI
jgi:Uma2 family endonuclease